MVTLVNPRLQMLKNTLQFRHAVKNCPTNSPPIWSGSNFESRPLQNSNNFLALHDQRVSKIECSAFFMMQDIRDFMADWGSMGSDHIRAFLRMRV